MPEQETQKTKKHRMGRSTAKNWKPLYTKIVGYCARGIPKPEIANLVNLSLSQIYNITGSDYFQERLNKHLQAYETKKAQIKANQEGEDKNLVRLEKMAQKAVTILEKALKGDATISKTQISTAKDVLDRAGYKPKERVEQTVTHHNYSPEEIKSAQVTMIEMSDTLERLSSGGTDFLLSGPAKRPYTEDDDGTLRTQFTELEQTGSDRQEGEPT